MAENEDKAKKDAPGYIVRYDPTPLTPRQLEAALLLAQGCTGVEVAKKLSITPQTVIQWKRKHLFQAEFNRQRDEIVHAARERIRQGIKQASDTLIELLGDNDTKIRLSAAKALLDKMDEPEKSGWGIGKKTVQELIEDEFQNFQRNKLFDSGGLGLGISEATKSAIADIIQRKDAEHAESHQDTQEDK